MFNSFSGAKMKFIKIISFLILDLIVIALVVAYFMPANYKVERSIIINKPVYLVYEQTSNLKNWLKWNPWTKTEPNCINVVNGAEDQIGARWAWQGNSIGAGFMTITNLERNKFVEATLVYSEPEQMESKIRWQFEKVSNGTKVILINEGELSYPFERFMKSKIENNKAPIFEKGLRNLKYIVEGKEIL